MKKSTLLLIWGGLYIACVLFGFLPEPAGALKAFMVLLSLGFFIPPVLLLRSGNARLVRNISIGSLVITLVFIIANFMTYDSSKTVGNVLYGFLNVVSAPMICSQYWIVSLFLWACLMVASISKLKKRKKSA